VDYRVRPRTKDAGVRPLPRRCAKGGTQRRELGSRAFDNPPIQLQEQGSAVSELNRRGIDEPAVRLETVARGEDGGDGLREEVGVLGRSRGCDVGQIGDDQVHGPRYRCQEVAMADEDAVFEPMPSHVGARECHRRAADVSRPDFDVRACDRDRNGDRAAAGTDIGHTRGSFCEACTGRRDQLLARCARRHHPPGCGHQRKTVEHHRAHTSSVSRRLVVLRGRVLAHTASR
jgi:hypothetical protein